MAQLSPEARFKQLTKNLSERDVYELLVLNQVIAMPSQTHTDRQTRLIVWQDAMKRAPE